MVEEGEKDKSRPIFAAFAGYVCIAQLYLLVFGVILVNVGNNLQDLSEPSTDIFYQIRADWTQVPFFAVSITNDWTCPDGQTEIFSRPWYGITAGCDCLDYCCIDKKDKNAGQDMSGCNEFIVDK